MFFFHGNFDMVGINDFSKTPIALHGNVLTGVLKLECTETEEENK